MTWDIGGNPFTLLPENFGGRLVIHQPATTSSVYDEHFRPRVYLRGSEPDSQVFNITRCKVKAASGERWVKVVSAGILANQEAILTLGTVSDNIRLPFSNVVKSGTQTIAVGIDQEVHYNTSDEYDTETPGSQSFKYYIHPQFFIYDTVTLSTEADFVLTKTDAETNTPLKGAVYNLYDGSKNAIKKDISTDSEGKLKVTGLTPGDYSIVETKAPTGYILDSTPIAFTVGAVTLSGGKTTINTTTDEDSAEPKILDGNTYTAADSQVYIAGPNMPIGTDAADSYYDPDGSPDIMLAGDTAVKAVTVNVTYAKLENGGDIVQRVFTTLADAQDDINAEKNNNNIIGPVTIKVSQTGSGSVAVSHGNRKEPSPTPSATPTVTPSASPTVTPSASPTATPSASPTATPSASPTATPSASPAVVPSVSPTVTPSASPSSSPNHKTGDSVTVLPWLALLAACAVLIIRNKK